MAGKEAEKRLHETDDESTAPFEHQQKVKSKKYMQKWKDEYYKLENMEKSTKGPHFAHCGVCHRDFSISHGGRNDITKHCASSTHKEAAKEGIKNRQLKLTTCFQKATDFKRRVTNAEATFTQLLAENNVPIAFSDKINKAVGKAFPDSEIAASKVFFSIVFFF